MHREWTLCVVCNYRAMQVCHVWLPKWSARALRCCGGISVVPMCGNLARNRRYSMVTSRGWHIESYSDERDMKLYQLVRNGRMNVDRALV